MKLKMQNDLAFRLADSGAEIERLHNTTDSQSANNLTVNHVTNIFNDSVISGDINIGDISKDKNKNH